MDGDQPPVPRLASNTRTPVRHEKTQHNKISEEEEGKRCTRIVGLNRYLAMGSRRTLKELYHLLQQEFGDQAPSWRTLLRWSADRDHYAGKNWAAMVQDYELMIAEEVMQKLATADAIVVFDEVSAFRKVAAGMLQTAEQLLSGKFKKPDGTEVGLAPTGTIKEITQMLYAAVEASEHVRRLLAGPQDPKHPAREFAAGRMETLAAALPRDLEERHRRYLAINHQHPKS